MSTCHKIKRMTAAAMAIAAIGMGNALAAEDDVPEGPHGIHVLSVTTDDAASPRAAVWNKAQAVQVTLQTAFAGHPAIEGTAETQKLTAQAVRTSARLFIKLAWRDRTANTEVKDTNQFLDAVAVEFPVYGRLGTVPYMGDTVNPVNLWQWRADGSTRNLLAKGFGTSLIVPTDGLRSAAVRTANGWEVVINRPLRVKPEEGADFQGQRTMPIAFAVWDGANQERDGFKAVTMEWWLLRF